MDIENKLVGPKYHKGIFLPHAAKLTNENRDSNNLIENILKINYDDIEFKFDDISLNLMNISEIKGYDSWRDYADSIGAMFNSMRDNYAIIKSIKDFKIENNQFRHIQNNIIEIYRNKINMGLITNTKLIYQTNNTSLVNIVHDEGTDYELNYRSLRVPFNDDMSINEVQNDLNLVKPLEYFLKAYYGTNDNVETIIDTLSFILNKPSEQIVFHVPPERAKIERPIRTPFMKYDLENNFTIDLWTNSYKGCAIVLNYYLKNKKV